MSTPADARLAGRVVALAGGVGGAKLAHGLAQGLLPGALTVVVNTGDDFIHLGLRISPDVDTVCYTLAGLANEVTGWGRADESWTVLDGLRRLGAPDWFQIGDRDLATHLERTRRMQQGETLSQVTAQFCAAWGVAARVLPMTDERVATWVETEADGWLAFQEYFVHQQCAPVVTGFRFEGAQQAHAAPGVAEAIRAAEVVIFCPSNPWVSIAPMLAIAEIGQALRDKPVVAVSPIVGGRAIKGPAAKMYAELGIQPSAAAVARHYQGLVSGMVIDTQDSEQRAAIRALGMDVLVTDTVMQTTADRKRLAEEVLAFGATIRQNRTVQA